MNLTEIDIRRILVILGHMVSPEGATGAPALFIGWPGGGKSTNMREFARRYLGGSFRSFDAPRFESTDLGIPKHVDGADYFKFVPPEGVYDLVRQERGLLAIEELNRARSNDVFGAFLSLILAHETEAIKAKHLHIWATMNPSEMVGGLKIDVATANRFVWCNWPRGSIERFAGYTLARDAWTGISNDEWPEVDPHWRDKWPEAVKAASLTVIQFLRGARDMFEEEPPRVARPYANERSWSLAINILASCAIHGATAQERAYLMAGTVGEGAGLAFAQWLSDSKLPPTEDIVFNRVDLASLDPYRAWASAASAIDYLRVNHVDHEPFVANMVSMYRKYPEVVCPLAARATQSGITFSERGRGRWIPLMKLCEGLREKS